MNNNQPKTQPESPDADTRLLPPTPPPTPRSSHHIKLRKVISLPASGFTGVNLMNVFHSLSRGLPNQIMDDHVRIEKITMTPTSTPSGTPLTTPRSKRAIEVEVVIEYSSDDDSTFDFVPGKWVISPAASDDWVNITV